MTITISLPPEVEEAVKSQATKEGKPLADYVESLVEEGSRRRDRIDLLAEKSFDEILAPFRQSVEDSGMSGEALVEFRSSERSWSWVLRSVYKYLTPNGVKTS